MTAPHLQTALARKEARPIILALVGAAIDFTVNHSRCH